jgi:hypothetical protein
MKHLLPLLGLLGCAELEGERRDTAINNEACRADVGAAAPLRLLTTTEVDRSVRDLLDVQGAAGARLPADPTVHGFEGFAETVSVSQLQADGYMRAAEDASAQIDWTSVLSCDATSDDLTCAQALIDDFGERAFRRPLLPQERRVFVGLFELMEMDQGFEVGVASVVQAMLQSPQFLYRIELGEPDIEGLIVPLTSYELASRLSYLLWASTPDGELLAAAADGSLSHDAVLEEHVDRMLADPRARDVVGRFVEQWTGIGSVDSVLKDALTYPTWSPELAHDLREETRRFSVDVVFDGEGTLEELLTADYTVANLAVANHYGLEGSSSLEEWVRLDLPADQRSGLLTQPSLLARAAHSNQTSPVHRGLFVFEQLFCGVQPQPPDELDITLPALDDNTSTRERFARHTQDPLCAGCHSVMDPIGFGFENYDAVGLWRATEGDGIPVHGSGVLTYSSQQDAFDGAVELSAMVAAAPEVQACFVNQWFRVSAGRDATDADDCALQTLDEAFEDGDILELIRAIPTTQTFRTRPVVLQ